MSAFLPLIPDRLSRLPIEGFADDEPAPSAVCSAADMEWIAPACSVRTLEPGQLVFAEGVHPEAIYVVRRGTVALSRERNGRRVTLQLLRDGSILGDVPILTGSTTHFDAVAQTTVELLSLPAPKFMRALQELPSFASRWVLWTARRLASMQGRLAVVLAGDLQMQVASLLLYEAPITGPVSLTQQRVAELLGVQRTSVSRVLHDLARRGFVSVGYGRIGVIDRRGLCAVALGAGGASSV